MSVPSTQEPQKIPVSQITRTKCCVIFVVHSKQQHSRKDIEGAFEDLPVVGT